jgi:hypothetical protein
MIVTWFTQPEGHEQGKTDQKYSSYYHYDRGRRILVRIRLELGRPSATDSGYPVINAGKRYVGFWIANWGPDDETLNTFQVAGGGMIQYTVNNNNYYLYETPLPGYRSCDFSFDHGQRSSVHKGSVVVVKENAYLPKGISEAILRRIAERFVYSTSNAINIIDRNYMDDEEFAMAIRAKGGITGDNIYCNFFRNGNNCLRSSSCLSLYERVAFDGNTDLSGIIKFVNGTCVKRIELLKNSSNRYTLKTIMCGNPNSLNLEGYLIFKDISGALYTLLCRGTDPSFDCGNRAPYINEIKWENKLRKI